MTRIRVVNHLTLDGVMQAPAGPEEDTRDGFAHGGWAIAGQDEVMGRILGEGMANGPGRLLFGRRTYEHMYGYWPQQTGNPISDVLDNAQKYVASRTLHDPLPWENSVLLGADAADAVAAIKDEGGNDIVVLGSGDLLQSLMARGLIDEYLLMIHPLVLGSGRRMFRDGSQSLTLVDSVITTKGVVMATYEPEAR